MLDGNVVQLEGEASFSSVELRRIYATSELVLVPKSVFKFPTPIWAPKLTPSQRTGFDVNGFESDPRRKLSSNKSAAIAASTDPAASSQQTAAPTRSDGRPALAAAARHELPSALVCEVQVIEAPAQPDSHFMRGDVLERHRAG